MPQVINSNIASLNAQRNLNTSQSSLQASLQRLSSGLRVNSAKDDAAGLAISERMTAQVRGLNQAARNANDGISLAQTAEGALASITENLQRVRELAVQAANATNSSTDRTALNNEATQLIAEIERVATTTQFNGVNLLDGTFTSQAFQVGANANQTISISAISSARTANLGVGSASSYSASAGGTSITVTTTALAAGDLTINGYQVGASASDGVSSVNATGSAIAKAAAINAISGQTNVTATVNATKVTGASIGSGGTNTGATGASDLTINGVAIDAVAASNDVVVRGANFAAAINEVSAQTGVTATFSTTTGALTLTATDGRNIEIEEASDGASKAGLTEGVNVGTYTLNSTSSDGITIGGTAGGATASGLAAGHTAATAKAGAGVSSLDLTTAAGAQNALTIIDAALSTVNSSRASLGAYQNRFGSTVTSLQTTAENLSASRSRIRDADFAAETAEMTRAQILQQAGTAMLAQANSLPQNVLTLLRG